MFGKRILILVPHPDDEVVACAATIARAKADGAEIFALYLTHGYIAEDAMWFWDRGNYEAKVLRRHIEGKTVAKLLGITPLGWSPRPARHLWKQLPQVRAEIAKAIQDNAIDQLWVPAYEGGNADHDGLHAVASLFAKNMSVLEFAEYNYANGKTQAQTFPNPNGTEKVIVLTEGEQQKKREDLALYVSERYNLSYVRTEHECYRPFAPADYRKPPHAGILWYTRFQWVPIPHPGVDRTQPREVCQAIITFLKSATNAPPAPAKQ